MVHYSDAGSEYTEIRLTKHLAFEGSSPSIGTVGDAYENALMETMNGLFKAECIRSTVFHAGPYRILPEVEFATAGWVDWSYNRCLHGTLGMLNPVRVRDAPPRGPDPRARTHKVAAENRGRFSSTRLPRSTCLGRCMRKKVVPISALSTSQAIRNGHGGENLPSFCPAHPI